MTSRYILDAAERCKLPISVEYIDVGAMWWVFPRKWRYYIGHDGSCETAEVAAATYLHLCASLQSVPAAPPLAGTATDCSASVSPLGGV